MQQHWRTTLLHERILVTGAGGFIGRRLVQQLTADGHEVVAWGRQNVDLCDAEVVARSITNITPTRIFHLASRQPNGDAQGWSRIAEEQSMISNLARSMPEGCQLIYTGSMAEYGYSGVLSEEARCAPDTAYGCAKYGGTTQAIALRTLLGADIRVARLFGVYGPGEAEKRLLPTVVRALCKGETVKLSDGKQVRDFVHVDDVVALLWDLSDLPREIAPPLCNIGTGVGVSVGQVCKSIAESLGAPPAALEFGAIARRSVDQDLLIADVKRLQTFTEIPKQRWLDKTKIKELVSDLI